MLQETMAKIKSAEEQAAQIVKDSETESRTIIEAAKAEAEKMQQDMLTARKENSIELSNLEKMQRETEIEIQLDEANQEIAALRNQVKAKETDAVNLIISQFASTS